MTAKKSIRAKKPARATRAKTVGAKTMKTTGWRLTKSVEAQAIFLVAICVMAVAIVLAARHSDQPAATTASATTPAAVEVADTAAPAALTPAHSADESAASTESARTASFVTISGCLQQSDETFRLTDTAGDSVPKARSWKSGFLKKSPASVEVVDVTNRLKLPRHVGQRVSVTGTLVDREMQIRALERVSTSCRAKGPQA
jgi:hypothetical protein